jgi:hypothetical protein
MIGMYELDPSGEEEEPVAVPTDHGNNLTNFIKR